jgi:hypothetical protein
MRDANPSSPGNRTVIVQPSLAGEIHNRMAPRATGNPEELGGVNGAGSTTHATRVRTDLVPRVRARHLITTIAAVLAYLAALFIVTLELWRGPTLLAISPTHGVDTGDLVVAPLIALALVLVRLGAGSASSGESDATVGTAARWSGPLSAVLLGGLLLIVGISRIVTAQAGPYDRLLAVAVVAAGIAFATELVRTGGRWTGRRGRSWWIPVALVGFGFLLDLALMPSGTVFGAWLLAVWFAATATDRVETAAGWLMAGPLAAVNAAALAGVADVMARGDGGVARAVALGGVLLVAGVSRCRNVMNGGQQRAPVGQVPHLRHRAPLPRPRQGGDTTSHVGVERRDGHLVDGHRVDEVAQPREVAAEHIGSAPDTAPRSGH